MDAADKDPQDELDRATIAVMWDAATPVQLVDHRVGSWTQVSFTSASRSPRRTPTEESPMVFLLPGTPWSESRGTTATESVTVQR